MVIETEEDVGSKAFGALGELFHASVLYCEQVIYFTRVTVVHGFCNV